MASNSSSPSFLARKVFFFKSPTNIAITRSTPVVVGVWGSKFGVAIRGSSFHYFDILAQNVKIAIAKIHAGDVGWAPCLQNEEVGEEMLPPSTALFPHKFFLGLSSVYIV